MNIEFLKKADAKLTGFLILFLLATVLPLLIISFYNQPSTDDYGCTTVVQAKGFFEAQKYFYYNWSGRYFATALASLNPLIYHSYTGYKILSFLLVAFFALAVYWLCRLIFFLKDRLFSIGISSFFVFMYFLHMPDIPQGLFWMSGSFTYQTAILFALLFLGCIIKFLQSGKVQYLVFSIILSFAIVGSNEVSMLYTDLTILLIAVMNYRFSKKANYYLILILAASALFSVFVITAPGNHIRGSYFPLQHQLVKSLQNTYNFGVTYLCKWSWKNISLFLFVFLFFLMNTNTERSKEIWLRPNLVFILFLCILIPFIGVFPGYWGMGITPPLRMMNVPYFYFLLCSVYFLYLLAEFIKLHYHILVQKIPAGLKSIFILIIISLTLTKPNNLRNAYDDLFTGRAMRYNEQMVQRREIVDKTNGNICQLKPIVDIPKTFYFQDITSDTADWKNKSFDAYYEKKCILMK